MGTQGALLVAARDLGADSAPELSCPRTRSVPPFPTYATGGEDLPVGLIGDSLDKAAVNVFTRLIPKSAGAQVRFLVKHEKGSTRTVAQRLGVSQRTVERYQKGQIKKPRPELADRLVTEVRKNWQPRVRDRARKQAATATGITIETRARFSRRRTGLAEQLETFLRKSVTWRASCNR